MKILISKQSSIQDFIPRIRSTSYTPVTAVNKRGALACVDRRVAIYPQLCEQSNVKQLHRLCHVTYNTLHNIHTRVRWHWSLLRFSLPQAALSTWIFNSILKKKKTSLFSFLIRFYNQHYYIVLKYGFCAYFVVT